MIAAITDSVALDRLPVNWFDFAVLLILAFGLLRGRKNGMTNELLRVSQWLALVIACGLCYMIAAQAMGGFTTTWSKSTTFLAAYMGVAFMVWLVFHYLKKIFVPRLTGSNIFGNGEYYLGMFSGMVRFACILIFALALLNAPVYTAADRASHQAYVKRTYGGGIYGGDYIPDLATVQDSVFKKSFVGPYIKDYLGVLLIDSGPAEPAKPVVAKTGTVKIEH